MHVYRDCSQEPTLTFKFVGIMMVSPCHTVMAAWDLINHVTLATLQPSKSESDSTLTDFKFRADPARASAAAPRASRPGRRARRRSRLVPAAGQPSCLSDSNREAQIPLDSECQGSRRFKLRRRDWDCLSQSGCSCRSLMVPACEPG